MSNSKPITPQEIEALNTEAEKALEEQNLQHLHLCYSRLRDAKKINEDALLRVVGTALSMRTEPMPSQPSENIIEAMKEVALAAIGLAKSVTEQTE